MFAPRNSSPTAIYGKEDVAAYEIKLKKVLGLTVCSNAALDVSPVSGLLAYPAGCTVVLFNAKRQTQAYLVNTSRKAFTSVAFSRCGRYVATGECGINPAIKVWELETPNGSLEHCSGGSVVAEFVDHKYAVTCVAFSPTGKYLVSVGSQHDMIVNVFDWRANLKMASNKISSKVAAVCFAEDGSYFVTVGNRHVKYWYLEGARKYKDPIPLMGRSAILGDLRDNDFCAVACGKGISSESTYAITRQGHLVEFSSRRLLDKWVQCRTTNANCICVNERFILVGCAESIIRIFNAATLEYVTTLPRTHYLGVDVAQGIQINHIMSVPQQAKFPDCIAMVFDEQRSKVSCVYNDHSLYIWDLRDISRVGKSHSFLYHSTCIWGVETVPYNVEREPSQTLPEECFVTCSSDDTIRVWGLDGCTNNDIYRRNIYSKELLKIVYSDEELQFIKDQGSSLFDKAGNSSYDGRNGVRCIKISPELQHLASGDRCGNIRVYSLVNLRLLTTIEAHESEVLCLEYSNEKIERKLLASASRDRLIHVFDVAQNYLLLQTLDDHSSSITSIKFVGAGLNFQMISCGADKSIMFRSFQGNIFMRGTNTSGKTTLYDMEVDSNSKHILTACQDRNVRVYGTQNAKQTKTFKGSHSDEGSLIKLSLDPSGIYVATSCTDKTLAVYDYYSSECMARMYGHSELVTGLKFTNDCRHLISASGDGCIFIWQVPHDMIVTMQARMSQQRLRSGHAPLPRPLAPISPPDGIVLESPTSEIEQPQMQPKFGVAERFSDVGQLPQWAMRKAAGDSDSGALSIPTPSGGGSTQVPAMHAASSMGNLSSSPSQQMSGLAPRPRGRWAQRSTQLETADDLRSNSESPLGTVSSVGGHSGVNVQTSDYNSASSKDITYNQTYLSEDSSIDSGMETRRGELKFIGSSNNGTVVTVSSVSSMAVSASNGAMSTGSAAAQQQRLQLPDKRLKPGLRFDTHTHDHDGDVEDISDGERTSSDHGIDFKVTAMNEDELRKSVRRQKFEKSGLQLTPSALSGNGSSHTASTGTGTGTSDTEDEGSTPSAENAERSLASTLGGSSENLPQSSSNSFLHAALPEGPGLTTPMERGGSSRRSISAKHNTENGKSVAAPPTITKSYTSTKKEELLQVINKVKQQLENGTRKNGNTRLNAIAEVGHRPLRGSHSISDLSLAANLDGSRNAGGGPGRYTKPDTEKMIDEITRKYGDLDEPCIPASYSMPANLRGLGSTGDSTPTGRTTQYYVYREFYQCERKVSLSDILQPEQFAASQRRLDEARFLETQRHSSASFFLTGQQSQESLSLLSDGDGASYCNSLESVLSDESDCQSAPLEYPQTQVAVLQQRHAGIRNFIIHGPVSKSYGNSPNAYGSFDYYMRQQHSTATDSFDVTGYNLEPLKPLPSSKTYPRIAQVQATENIPTLRSKNKQYNSGVNKSLSTDFAQQRQQRNSNPMQLGDNLFVRKPLKPKPPVPAKPQNLVSTLSHMENKQQQQQQQRQQKSQSRTASVVQQFEHNLQKFEKEKQRERDQQRRPAMRSSVSSGALAGGSATQSCLKKVSRFDTSESSRRATSVRQKSRPKISVRFNTVSQIKYTPSAKRERQARNEEEPPEMEVGSLPSDYGERSFEMYFAENGNAPENLENMQSLKLYTKPQLQAVVDEIQQEREKYRKNLDNAGKINGKGVNGKGSSSTSHQCQNIAKKIDIIEKLIAMEENKMEQIRLATESRLRPFNCNAKEKGYVKSLTMNFDMLARGEEHGEDEELSSKDASDLCAYARNIRRNCSLPDVLESTDFTGIYSSQGVELAKEVIADDEGGQDIANPEISPDNPNHDEDVVLRMESGLSPRNPKTLNPMPIEESSIRRACSLSDLHMGNFGKPGKSNGTPQKPQAQHRNGNVSRSASKRNSLQGKTGLGASSNSMNVLNQGSDSEPEDSNRLRSASNGQGRSNGPIAANRQYSNKINNVNNNRRKTPNFSSATPMQDDSSSEETPNSTVNNKPIVPPRPRNLAFDHKSKLMINNIGSPGGNASKQRSGVTSTEDYEGTDPEAQVHNVINKLYTTTQAAMQLHANLKNSLLLKELENALIMSRNMLSSIPNRQAEKTNNGASGMGGGMGVGVGGGGGLNHDQLSADNGDYLMMVNNCADLLSNLRTKHKPDDCENNS
ncbi:hypothetical protein M5D96_003707 [Drosophila gunungcola]|uniref:MABP1/WDR62 second WD40 domain-containing protein n=1 Tax=Drosophila gunungcola TaxID=103775 RepID=A0A9Q0BSP6_9MUSC|nr:hypothetical protein M5D96_003707 [Drosophila gunungcola]